MKQFFKFLLASFLGTLLTLILLIFIVVGTIGFALNSSDNEKEIQAHSIIKFELNGSIKERTLKPSIEDLPILGGSGSSLGLQDILENIKKAEKDPNVDGIFLNLSSIDAGLSTLEEIRNALIDFKLSKKFIYAYSEVYTQKAYYLASVANKVYLNPAGLLELRGFSSNITFYKGALDKLGVEAQVIKVGTFKSAVEPFILDKMSDANRLQVSTYLNSINNTFTNNIALSRNIPFDTLLMISNKLLAKNPADCMQLHLVDGLKYYDEVLEELKSLSNRIGNDKLLFVSLKEYNRVPNKLENKSIKSDKIAIVYAEGEIISGEGDDGEYIGSERLSEAIRKARLDTKIKAVVLRVNSPGGSALASEIIWREVMLTKKIKPVIVSMGNVAASGGYFIACAADKIVAQENTITGSIGVFGIIPNTKKFFNEKLGISFDGVKTGEFSDLGNLTRPLTESERFIIQGEVNNIYDSFISKVSEGRKMSKEKVDSIGQGRVWTGKDALAIGLVDTLGGIDLALKLAAKAADLPEYRIVRIPELKDPMEELLKSLGNNVKTSLVKEELGSNARYYNDLKHLINLSGVQARIPYYLDIQ